MRLLLELAMFVVAPGAPPEGLPLWLAGIWCPAWRVEGAVEELARPTVWLGEQCMTWAVKGGAMRAEQRFAYSGRNDSITYLRVEASGGRLQYSYRVDEGYRGKPKREQRLRQVSRGPNEIVFEGGQLRTRFVRDGDVLTLEETGRDGKTYSGRYRRAT